MSIGPKDVVLYLEALKEGATAEECAMLDVARAAVLEMTAEAKPSVEYVGRKVRSNTLVKADVRQEEIPWPSDNDRE